MSINATNDAQNHSVNSTSTGRILVRNSSGIPYLVCYQVSGTEVQVWKGNSATPTSFSQQDSANNPSSGSYSSPTCAIDGSDVIHIAYVDFDAKNPALRYVTFDTSTDTFSGDVQVDANGAFESLSRFYIGIAIDANDVPHITYNAIVKNMGTGYNTVWYINKVGGSWNTPVQVEGYSASKSCYANSICIDNNNYPFIAYLNDTDQDLTWAAATSNNPSSFTLTDKDTTAATGGGTTGVAVKSDGTKVSNYTDSDQSIVFMDGSTVRDTGKNEGSGTGSDIACVGNDVYIFYENDTSNDICYDVWNGSSWAGETVLDTGTYTQALVKWSWEANFDSGGTNRNDSSSAIPELDYTFKTASDDIWFGTLTLAAPADPIPDRLVQVNQSVKQASEW